MKVKIVGDITVEEVIEIDDKFAKVVLYNNSSFGVGTDEEADEAVHLSEEAADIAVDYFAKKYGDNFRNHSAYVYNLNGNVIFEE